MASPPHITHRITTHARHRRELGGRRCDDSYENGVAFAAFLAYTDRMTPTLALVSEARLKELLHRLTNIARAFALLVGLGCVAAFWAGSETVLQQVAYGTMATALFVLLVALKE